MHRQSNLRPSGYSIPNPESDPCASTAPFNWDGALMGASLGQMAGATAGHYLVACFTAGTPLVVDHAGNSRPIEEIEVGDHVLARSEFDPDGPLELKRVEEKFVRVSPVMELVIDGRSIKTTAEHPFYVPARQTFVPAGELNAGEHLISHDGQLVEITSVNSTDEITTVYNLRVADHHTYFVGGEVWGWDIWVHNVSIGYTKEYAEGWDNLFGPSSGHVIFGALDELQRPTGIRATITRKMIGTGSDAAHRIRPPGFGGQASGHARGHLLGNQLGGSGTDRRNLVTLFQNPTNHPNMSGLEGQIAAAVKAGETVNYWAIPIYRGDELIPIGVTLKARGSNGFSLDISLLNIGN